MFGILHTTMKAEIHVYKNVEFQNLRNVYDLRYETFSSMFKTSGDRPGLLRTANAFCQTCVKCGHAEYTLGQLLSHQRFHQPVSKG